MTPIEYYAEQCSQGLIHEDPEQCIALRELQVIYDHLLKEHQRRSRLLSRWRQPKLVQGIYLWGGVGIGKTFLMDCFFHCIPFPQKMRMHFHHFMQLIHQELKVHQGKKDPLSYIAADLARKNNLICFDELMVNDIVDAMLLGRLFSLLFSKGVCLVTTSNVMPDDLYKNGLQRSLFLPAIATLKQFTKIQHLAASQDYRLRHAQNNHLKNEAHLEQHFSLLTKHAVVSSDPIEICERIIPIIKKTQEVIWFDFNKICNIPRSQQDYLAIARQYHTVFISNLKAISPESHHRIHLFMHMVDVFYDAGVRLIISSAIPIDQIYQQGRMATDFIRTRSRLIEMQASLSSNITH